MPWQFRVIDGGDLGRTFPLPDAGVTTVGSSRKHADISLNDLYAARVHCDVETGERVVVTDHDTPGGTLVNGQKVKQQEIRHGDVVRMGNSHLRLEDVETAAKEAAAEEELPELEVEVLEEEEAPAGAAGAAAMSETAVHETQVASHETNDAVANDAVANDAVVVATSQAQPLPDNRLRELAGHTLAHFQVEDVIAAGHSGMVFRARDLKTDQTVALKVLSPDFPSRENFDQEMQRFVQVGKALLGLRYDHLVSVLGVGKTGPYCWLAQELIEHAPVPELIRRAAQGQPDFQRAYRIAVHMARALAFAHKHRLVHRNITAKHILWRPANQTAKLADLGLSAALQGSAVQRNTWRDKLQSELVYLPPEQTQPDSFVGGVCDLYRLGVVIYALLTGHFPCSGATQAETIRAIRETIPVRPTRFQPAIPPAFEMVVLRMLSKHQEDRHQSAEELLEDLEQAAEEPAPAVARSR
jgi:hypothetical protein